MNSNFISDKSHELEHPVSVIIVDDEKELCDSLRLLLEATKDIKVLGTGYSGKDAIALASKHNPQVILLDLHYPEGMDGIEVIKIIKSMPQIKSRILVHSYDASQETVFDAIKMGASSYAWKNGPHTDLVKAVHDTAKGIAYTSPSIANMVLEFFEVLERESLASGTITT